MGATTTQLIIPLLLPLLLEQSTRLEMGSRSLVVIRTVPISKLSPLVNVPGLGVFSLEWNVTGEGKES